MKIQKIESAQNKTVKEINALKTKKERDKSGLFVLEGERLVSEAVGTVYVAVSEDYNGSIPETPMLYKIKSDVFSKLTETVNSQGIIAVCRQQSYDIEEVLNKQNPLFVVLENVNDPGNMGTILRTADAAGADAVFISKGSADVYNPKTVRATMGSVFHLPVFKDVDMQVLISRLKEKNITTVAALLNGTSTPYDVDMTKGCAILIGNEANGLTEETAKTADIPVLIPMPGKAESMNAGVAAGVLIYEAVRQRLMGKKIVLF
jgi:TrmH family RNA methyltransferase